MFLHDTVLSLQRNEFIARVTLWCSRRIKNPPTWGRVLLQARAVRTSWDVLMFFHSRCRSQAGWIYSYRLVWFWKFTVQKTCLCKLDFEPCLQWVLNLDFTITIPTNCQNFIEVCRTTTLQLIPWQSLESKDEIKLNQKCNIMLNPTLAIAFIAIFAIIIGNVFTIFVFQSQSKLHLKILEENNSFFAL